MRKSYISRFLMSMTVGVLFVLGTSCNAEEPSTKVDSEGQTSNERAGVTIERSPMTVRVHILKAQQRIIVTPPFASICSGLRCDGDSFEWLLVQALEEGEMVRIRNVDEEHGYLQCFPGGVPVDIVAPHNGALSGDPAAICERKYGTYWPYVIEYWNNGTLEFSNDPGAIIFP